MSELNFEVREVKTNCGTVIKVVGIGGCGSNMVNRMISESKFASSIDLIVANTDIQDLEKSESQIKLQLGKEETSGQGAGGKPEVGLASAQEAEEEIKRCLSGVNMLFLATGLGGGTGTGAAPFIAKIGKELGALVIGIATMPFKFERRDKKATKGLLELKKECDSVILIHNEQLGELADEDATMEDCFNLVDSILLDAVECMLTILLTTGKINLDFKDIKEVMSHRGLAKIGSGKACGPNAINDAFSKALSSPLLDAAGRDHSNAKGFLAFVIHGNSISFKAFKRAFDEQISEFDEDVECYGGVSKDPNLADDEAHVYIVLTGFDGDDVNKEVAPETLARVIKAEELLQKTSNSDTDFKSVDFTVPSIRRIQQD